MWLVGPAGSDKALVARAIHTWSSRSGAPMETLGCGAVPEALQGREILGCAEGVYPAVPGEYTGALERAADTTLLLQTVQKARKPDVVVPLLQALARRPGNA